MTAKWAFAPITDPTTTAAPNPVRRLNRFTGAERPGGSLCGPVVALWLDL